MKCSDCSFGSNNLKSGEHCEECGRMFPASFYDYSFQMYVAMGTWLCEHRIWDRSHLNRFDCFQAFKEISGCWLSLSHAATEFEIIEGMAWANHLEHINGELAIDYAMLVPECVQAVSEGLDAVWSNIMDDASVLLEDNWFADTWLVWKINLESAASSK